MTQAGRHPDPMQIRIRRLFWVYLSALAFLFLCVAPSLVITEYEARQLTMDARHINMSGRHQQIDYPGSGLELATCQRIALNHAGRILVQSAPGRGNTFAVVLHTPFPRNSSRPEDLAA